MESELACIDGQLIPQAQAVIPVTDQGLLRGDGVFEVIRLYGGRPYALDAHLERLERSAAGLRLPLDSGAIRSDIAALLAARAREDVLVRMLLTRGGHRIVLIEPMPAIPASLALEPVTYAPVRLLDGIKSLSYGANMLASRLAREAGADDALLVTPHGRVLECPTSSFFIVREGEVWTAPLSDHVLDSITRRVVLAVAAVREEPIELAALADAQEAFIASTPHEVSGVHRVGSHRYDAPGTRTSEIAALVRERIASELR
ncbi:MAG TPA: aminotransferase class IV [Solirubrobacteraceae bacterium]|nr:aminotransferase class IV [Solirubrobacteraceae bacterium]